MDDNAYIDPKDLHFDPENFRLHPDENQEAIRQSLEEVGGFRSIAVDGENIVRAGNGVWEQALKLGLKPRVFDINPDEIAVVRRKDLIGNQAKRAALLDNYTGESSVWDMAMIAEQAMTDPLLFEGMGSIVAMAVDAVQQSAASPPPADEVDDDEFEPPRPEIADQLREEWQTVEGQVWKIPSRTVPYGCHRLVVGSATNPAAMDAALDGNVARMCFTDPPWNVNIGRGQAVGAKTGDRGSKFLKQVRVRPQGLINDNLGEHFGEFLNDFTATLVGRVSGDLYCVMGASEWPTVDAALREAGFHWSCTIIWVKDKFVFSQSKYHRQYEPIWYGWHEKSSSSYNMDDRTKSDVWEIPRPKTSEEHPTMKPVPLVARAIENSSQTGDLVIDPFMGSGTTLLACESMSRLGCGTELDPRYAAVILERLKAIGLQPELERESYA